MLRPKEMSIQGLLMRAFVPAVLIVALLLGAIVYDRLYATILDGFDRKLVSISALTGALIDPEDHARLVAQAQSGEDAPAVESTQSYRRGVLPMRRISEALGLTYLYTQVLGGSQDVVYILDATEGENHSPFASEDEMTPATLAGLRDVEAHGSVYVSPIEFQEQWGLLKTAAAPLHGPDGRIAGSAGADVNVSIIEIATQNAVLASAIVALISLGLCTLAGMALVRRVARPIAALKLDALRIAAGDREPLVPRPAPREVMRLQLALAATSETLSAALDEARDEKKEADHARALSHLENQLQDDRQRIEGRGWMLAAVDAGTGPKARLRWHAIRAMAERVDDAGAMAALLEGQAGAFLVLDRGTGRLTAAGDRAIRLSRGGRDAVLEAGETMILGPGEDWAVDRDGLPLHITWEIA